MPAILVRRFAAQQKTSTFRWQKCSLFYLKFSAEFNEISRNFLQQQEFQRYFHKIPNFRCLTGFRIRPWYKNDKVLEQRYAKTYTEPCQTSKMELFVKIVNGHQLFLQQFNPRCTHCHISCAIVNADHQDQFTLITTGPQHTRVVPPIRIIFFANHSCFFCNHVQVFSESVKSRGSRALVGVVGHVFSWVKTFIQWVESLLSWVKMFFL